MSLFGALFTGVSALNAQSQSMGIISNNIANVSTVGYKKIEADFRSTVTSQSNVTSYSSGSVQAVRKSTLAEQGNISQTNSPTDISITGNGFFVTRSTNDDSTAPIYTRAGSFAEDSQGFLRNTAGNYLYGWPLDDDGNIPTANANLSSLEPIQVSFAGGLTRPTSVAELAVNLNAAEENNAYPFTGAEVVDFSRGITVFDSLGTAQDLTVNFTKHESPTAQFNGNVDLSDVDDLTAFTNINDGDQFSIEVGGNPPVVITISTGDNPVDLASQINANVDGVTAAIDENGFLNIYANNTGEDLTLADVTGTPLGSGDLGLATGTDVAPVAPNLGTPLASEANPQGWWKIEIEDPNGGTLFSGSINFLTDGSVNGIPDINGDIDIPLSDVNFGNGSDLQDIDFNITSFTQFSGEYNVVFVDQNGAELGLRTGVSIDDEGYLVANFSNGQSTRIYQIPLATFANPNGLSEVSGNGYTQTDQSGDFNLRVPGAGGSGLIQGGTLEASNVDLADEFSDMIVTQRAYSAGTKVISTADEMTEELLRLR